MNLTISDKFEQLVKDKEIQFDQKQYELINILAEKSEEFIAYTKQSLLKRIINKKMNRPLGMYIYGQVGRGKSMIMDLFYNNIDISQKRRVHFNEFMNEVHEQIFIWRKKNGVSRNGDSDPVLMVAKLIEKDCKLLCFDEFQVEDIADAMILGRLFKILFEMGILIIATSNIHPRNLYSEGLNRDTFIPFIDKLEENMEIYNLQAEKDYRIDRIKNKRVYFSPINGQNKKNFHEAWQNLIGSIEVTSRSIPLKGREIEVSVSAGKFANFSFDELCVKPLGVADYLAISNNYNIIFISNVPKLDSKKRNETKRFINLIDTFYENKKILFILAETHPKDILIGGKDANIFQRTVSRLEEMQSSDYLDTIISE
ncbi:MAG: cell division protein ZapE [Pseudomonadota bacterium]|nr:cell division protein ZapE [Pseudomonadota bacterium]